MPRTQHVPGAHERGVESEAADRLFALRARLDVSLHRRGGLRDADVNEVADAGLCGRLRRGTSGGQVHRPKLFGLGGRRVSYADEL